MNVDDEQRLARTRSIADTAFAIAAVRAEEARRPEGERLFEDPYASLFVAAGAQAAESTERYLSLPFFTDGIRLRTRFIDDALRAALEAGLDQVVILGAGFDARGLRLPEILARRASVYEIDTAEQLARKKEILVGARIELPAHVRYVGFDFDTPPAAFESSLVAALETNGFRRGAGALFVWEGVIGYIDAAAIDLSLRFMANAGGPRSRVVFTFGEGSFDPDGATERTRRAGFGTCEEIAGDALWRRYLPSAPHEHAFLMKIGVATV